MKALIPLLLLALVGCSKKEDPAALPVVVPVKHTSIFYTAAYLEEVYPVITADLSSTPYVDITTILPGNDPYYLGTSAQVLDSHSLNDTLTVTLRVPRMPTRINTSMSMLANVNFGGLTYTVELSSAYLLNRANYGPTGAIARIRVIRQ